METADIDAENAATAPTDGLHLRRKASTGYRYGHIYPDPMIAC